MKRINYILLFVLLSLLGVQAQTTQSEVTNYLHMDTLVIVPGTEGTIPVNLSNTAEIIGMQIDISLPKGLTLKDISLNADRMDGHMFELYKDNGRLLIFNSNENKAFKGNTGTLFTLHVSSTKDFESGDALISKQVFTDANGKPIPTKEEVKAYCSKQLKASIKFNKVLTYTYDGQPKKLSFTLNPSSVKHEVICDKNRSKNVGTYTDTVRITDPLYIQDEFTQSYEIVCDTLKVEGLTAADTVYNGSTLATLRGGVLEGVVGGDDATVSIPTQGVFSQKDAGKSLSVSIAPLVVTGKDSANYFLTQPTSLTATISKKVLTLTAKDTTRIFGTENPPLAVVANGFIKGESTSTLDTFSIYCSAEKDSLIGTYDIILKAGDKNYAITTTNGTLTVKGERPIVLTTFAKTAADTLIIAEANLISTGGNKIDSYGLRIQKASETPVDSTAKVKEGLYSTMFSGLTKGATYKVYAFAKYGNDEATGDTLVVNLAKGTPTLTFQMPTEVVYSNSKYALDAQADSIGSFKYTVVSENNDCSIDKDSIQFNNVGTYRIKATFEPTNDNQCDAASAEVVVKVLPKTLTTSGWEIEPKGYDGSMTAKIKTMATLQGIVGDDEVSLIENNLSANFTSSTADSSSIVTISGLALTGDNANKYRLNSQEATAYGVIKPKALTITANATTREYGENNPNFSVTATGFIGGESLASLNGSLKYSCSAIAASMEGNYAIMPYGVSSENYKITFKADSLCVKAGTPEIKSINAVKEGNKLKLTGEVLANGKKLGKGYFRYGDKETSDIGITNGRYTTTVSDYAKDKEIKIYACVKDETGKPVETASPEGISFYEARQDQVMTINNPKERAVFGEEEYSLDVSNTIKDALLGYSSSDNLVADVTAAGKLTFKGAGTTVITVSHPGNGNYNAVQKTMNLTVAPKEIEVTGVIIAEKTYDGTTVAKISDWGSLDGKIENQESIKANFASTNAGTWDVVFPTLILKDKNYTIKQPIQVKGAIKKASLKLTTKDQYIKFGEPRRRFQVSYDGFIKGESETTKGIFEGVLTFEGEGTEPNTDPGHKITPKGLTSKNYELTFKAGYLKIGYALPRVATIGKGNDYPTSEIKYTGGYKENNYGLLYSTYDNIVRYSTEMATRPETLEKYHFYRAYMGYNSSGGNNAENYVYGKSIYYRHGAEVATEEALFPSPTTRSSGVQETISYGKTVRLKKPTKPTDVTVTYETSDANVLSVSSEGVISTVGLGTATITATATASGKNPVTDSKTYSVTAPSVKINGLAVVDKDYDGSSAMTIDPTKGSLTGVSGDIEIDYSNAIATAKDASVGDSKTVTISGLVLKGGDAEKYTLNATSWTVSGAIKPKTISNVTAAAPIYYGHWTFPIASPDIAPGDNVEVTIKSQDAGAYTVPTTHATLSNGNYKLGEDFEITILKQQLIAQVSDAPSAEKAIISYTDADGTTTVTPSYVTTEPTKTVSNKQIFATGFFAENYEVIEYKQGTVKSDPTPEPEPEPEPEVKVESVMIDPATIVLNAGDKANLTATVSPSNAKDKSITWKSSNPEIATITADGNEKGKVKALKAGQTTVTVTTADGGHTAECTITVSVPTSMDDFQVTQAMGLPGYIKIYTSEVSHIRIYATSGQLIHEQEKCIGEVLFKVNQTGVYFVTVGDKEYKVQVK